MWKSYEKRKGVYELKRLQKIQQVYIVPPDEIPDRNKCRSVHLTCSFFRAGKHF